ncbi:hypothetical protein TTHERM_00161080 (macronuclear) [Tetrahymena thermophila SB210]|uniref:Uncharacterized protein n=1 Tax=Tetrahymena thermophila (strain SB210) TaxID=312017 RepID=Q22W24_TETTS|nr:hypothetical protein TTHERM_00161080 [Tetrahymena thermophila SB210]EAR89593.1 hypothetical protein TTHERM_00161080 [Tetrahymena thermophila SB210]|eukprot:XP_001009838.1 hypothetical protein TTHERM_00161080 [Tetrahymena thermophila SB210]
MKWKSIIHTAYSIKSIVEQIDGSRHFSYVFKKKKIQFNNQTQEFLYREKEENYLIFLMHKK